MALRDLHIEDYYSTGDTNIVTAFYAPCLQRATSYDRAVGYFTSDGLAAALPGVRGLIANSGKMRLVASPILTSDDIAAISAGYSIRDVLDRHIDATVQSLVTLPVGKLHLLTWLISHGLLDIKVAVRLNGRRAGIYHEKFGIFGDSEHDSVVFVGSSNETVGGLFDNYESVEVFRSWEPEELSRVVRRRSQFEALWNNEQAGLYVKPFSAAARDRILRHAPPPDFDPASVEDDITTKERGSHNEDRASTSPSSASSSFSLRDYQIEALEKWKENGYRGILEMATGTGKTLTAIGAIAKLSKGLRSSGESLFVVVAAPFKALVEQWRDEIALALEQMPLLCYESQSRWRDALHSKVLNANHSISPLTVILVTNATLSTLTFREALRSVRVPFLFVGDEAHNLGAPVLLECLPDNATHRLALSATPDRHFDDDGTAALKAYFGDVVYAMDLRTAIERGALCRYYYHIHQAALNESESTEYIALSRRIAAIVASAGADALDSDPNLQRLLIRRSRLIARCADKLSVLEGILPGSFTTSEPYNLIYCGDGNYANDDGTFTNQITEVLRILGNRSIPANKYTAETSRTDRTTLLSSFESGDLHYLVAIRCLDEGIDIPATRSAIFMASSTNPRQFIQRRGRVLRRHNGKEYATIHDIITKLPDGLPADLFDIERALFRREYSRIRTFADLALNGPQAVRSVLDLLKQYNLMHLM